MKALFVFGLVACLALIFIQDLKYRKIHVAAPLSVFIMAEGIKGFSLHWQRIVAVNLLFLLVVMAAMVAYMSIRKKAILNPFEHYFGLGDLLFYAAITPLFLLTDYIAYFIGSMLFALLLSTVFRKRIAQDNIPLAGFSAVFLIAVLGCDLLLPFPKIILPN
ncbi:hypothetical protein HUK80_00035 [Flavobacterium sp. MAH-1]|uniref:Prepilin type IV endopeptidase peptidase domain-containing protein n=1 Tax=Flavobacterium agri TaxID=2743471 RepID=A0A7Y9C5E9_9FLAO|nr:hypothetical protein [Flavobacterium agri]NUY79264.1 hypothetical protein [Flavobacterium agri]NYA69288.1 hypothetical protein [Flavobacterium agri]